jgi:hypothetical protein
MIAAELRDMRDFLRDVAVDTVQVAMRRELWVPAVTFSLLADATMLAVNYAFRAGLPPPAEHMITMMTLVILAKCWFSLTLARIALALHRGPAGRRRRWRWSISEPPGWMRHRKAAR